MYVSEQDKLEAVFRAIKDMHSDILETKLLQVRRERDDRERGRDSRAMER